MSGAPTRRGRGRSQTTLALIDAIKGIVNEMQPISVRGVCYQLFVKKLIPAMAKGETDRISKLLVWMRETEVVPWHAIVDETRSAERTSSWENPLEIIDTAVRQYRKDYWSMQPNWVEVLSEKGTLRGTLKPILEKYGVTFRVMHGYGSATALKNIADDTADSEKPLTILYIGDWDPSGLQMSEVDLPDRLDRYGGDAYIERVALDQDDVAEGTTLPFFKAETKAKDSRYAWFVERYGHRCWEVDALSPVVLRERVEAQIVSLLDVEAWNHAIGIEQAERESMSTFFDEWSISMQAPKYSPPAGAV